MDDQFVSISASAKSLHHLLMITSVMTLCALEEETGVESSLGVAELTPAIELQALMKKLQAAPAEESIWVNEREFVLLHGCCLLSSRLLLHERGEALLAPLVAHLAVTQPEAGIDFALLRKYLLLNNELLARRGKDYVDCVPSMQAMQRAIEALTF